MREHYLPYCLPSIGEAEIAEVVDSLRSGWVTTGPKVKRFEEDFQRYVGARHAIAVSSCTTALHLSLAAHQIGQGDEVIVPAMTFCATANVVVHLGARPVLVDVDENGLLDPEQLQKAITPKTRAIVPVHYAGQSCDLDRIWSLADQFRLHVVEDAAHAVGTTYKGRRIGGYHSAAAFSFYATKNMTTGEGGMVTTSDDALASRIRRLSLHGMSRDAWNRYSEKGSWYYEVTEPGYKGNMTDIQAAIGLHQLARLQGFIARRREIAGRYDRRLERLSSIELPKALSDRGHVYHLYPIRLKAGLDRSAFIESLKARRIGASVHFVPLYRHPYYRSLGYRPEQFPVAERIYSGTVSLPLYPGMTDADVEDVIAAVSDLAERPASGSEGTELEAVCN